MPASSENRDGANERAQKLKFHSQTSGRSLHAQEIAFNDIRTTLQALISSYDEAITTPTDLVEEAVRVCSLGQITHALFEVGGQYRRSM